MERLSLSVVLAAVFAGAATGQTVHLVGPGGFPQIQDAVIAAAPGDVIHVQAGTYSTLFVTKGLTIRALIPGTVTLGSYPVSVFQPPANESVHLVGLRFPAALVNGSATFDGCTFDLHVTSLTVQNGRAHLQDCVLAPPPNGFWALPTVSLTNADVTVVDSRIEGMDALAFQAPASAIALTNSVLRGSGLIVRAGNGAPPTPAVTADAASRVWLSDSTVSGDPASCPLSVAQGRHDRCTITPPCSGIPAGFVLGARRLAPPQPGAPLTVEFRAAPNAPIGVIAALALELSAWPTLEQSLLLPVATAYPVTTLIADATGLAAGAWLIPANPLLVDREIWLQGFSGSPGLLQASAVLGGLVR